MNLNNLKPAWRQFQLVNSLQPTPHHELLEVLEHAERVAGNTNGFLVPSLIFLLITFCCQGG